MGRGVTGLAESLVKDFAVGIGGGGASLAFGLKKAKLYFQKRRTYKMDQNMDFMGEIKEGSTYFILTIIVLAGCIIN